ncbi:MAG: MotA/TolQ/ExbB proton channel family protein [Cellvibrionaceae bacterium]
MKNITRTIFIMAFAILTATTVSADVTEPVSSLEQLLDRVVQSQRADAVANRERVQDFVNRRDQQRQLLDEVQAEIAEQERISASLKQTIESNKDTLAELEDQLLTRLGDFDELFGVTRQVAGDTLARINSSIISAQFPGRERALANIAQEKKALPSIEQLSELWLILLQEQTEQAKVATFSASINNAAGEVVEKQVTRIGPFNAVADGNFLVYNGDAGRLTTLHRQPAAVYRRSAEQMEHAAPGQLVTATIDPSSGAILSLLVQAPNLLERFHQGGLVGYLVTLLAAIGLTIGVQRMASLWWTATKVKRQMRSKQLDDNNPLGRVLQSYQDNTKADPETLELKLEDAVMKEVPKLERGLNTLKVLAAVAPLMGLLGTVIGMIITFQSITLWGTGDPKLMAGGISQALMTTVLGLIAAIPLLLLHSMASGRARLLQQILQEQSAGLLAKRAEVARD